MWCVYVGVLRECKWLSEWHFCVWQATDIGKERQYLTAIHHCRFICACDERSDIVSDRTKFKVIRTFVHEAKLAASQLEFKARDSVAEVQLIWHDSVIDLSLFHRDDFHDSRKTSPTSDERLQWKELTVGTVASKLKRRRWFILVFALFEVLGSLKTMEKGWFDVETL